MYPCPQPPLSWSIAQNWRSYEERNPERTWAERSGSFTHDDRDSGICISERRARNPCAASRTHPDFQRSPPDEWRDDLTRVREGRNEGLCFGCLGIPGKGRVEPYSGVNLMIAKKDQAILTFVGFQIYLHIPLYPTPVVPARSRAAWQLLAVICSGGVW